jgi:hypothetical protein
MARKLNLEELIDEWCSLRKAQEKIGAALEKFKSTIVSIPKDKWAVDSNGTKYLWSEKEKLGVKLVTPSNKPELNYDKAVAYCVAKKLKSCLKYSLNSDGFKEAVESGVIPTEDLESLMSPPEKPKEPYIQKMGRLPKDADA